MYQPRVFILLLSNDWKTNNIKYITLVLGRVPIYTASIENL